MDSKTEKSFTKKFSLKSLWARLRPNRKAKDENSFYHVGCKKGPAKEIHNSEIFRYLVENPKDLTALEKACVAIEDINEIDKDTIRTSCREALDNPPVFPSREQVKERIESAHKYYGIKCVYNYYVETGGSEDNKELQPSWYYILERPLVEQYVLMNNYIRKLSVMASLKNEQVGVEEEPAIEEEVSSISSSSDMADFAPDSKIAEQLKQMKKIGSNHSTSLLMGTSKVEQEMRQLKVPTKNAERTIKTNEYTIIIREPTEVDDGMREGIPSTSNALEIGRSSGHPAERVNFKESDPKSSGDHHPDMNDFDLSYNLMDGPVERRKCGLGHPSFYHWQGNSTPTKTPLLNMDCQPPVRPRAPGTAKDFMSFRNLSLSSEFMDSCRDYSIAYAEECRSVYLRELTGCEDLHNDTNEEYVNSETQTEHNKNSGLQEPLENCNSVLVQTFMTELLETDAIKERVELESDRNRKCGDLPTDYGAEDSNVNCSEFKKSIDEVNKVYCSENDCCSFNIVKNSADTPSASCVIEVDSLTEIEDEQILGTSVSHTDALDSIDSESASSVETQIPSNPTHPK